VHIAHVKLVFSLLLDFIVLVNKDFLYLGNNTKHTRRIRDETNNEYVRETKQ